uniref:UspA domain-containing protein n=1 Tax=Arion vulgaris TaxID=1028688 RepID=A0A0B7AWC4_9EUPU
MQTLKVTLTFVLSATLLIVISTILKTAGYLYYEMDVQDTTPTSQDGGRTHGKDANKNKTIVLIAVDGSKHSFYALDWYLSNIHKPDTDLLVANCSDYSSLVWTPMMSTDSSAVSKMIQHCDEETNNIIAQIQERLTRAKVNAKLLRLSGDSGPTIVKAAKEHKVNYIVTGSRGLGTVRRTLIGSVSSYIVHHVHCPVLVCHYKN